MVRLEHSAVETTADWQAVFVGRGPPVVESQVDGGQGAVE